MNTKTNYPIGDFLIRLKNATLAGQKKVAFPKTNLTMSVSKALEKAGFVGSVKAGKDEITMDVAYQKKEPVMMGLKLVSKPGLRVYKTASELSALRGASSYFVSTPKGVMTAKEAAKMRTGGELIVEVW